MRLRPSGRSGPVATSLAAFAAYQRGDAWTWEHMALVRARPIAGPEALRAALTGCITQALVQPRDRAKLAADVRDMRERIAAEKGDRDPWDLKLVRGGLTDIDFIAQFLALAHAAARPDILRRDSAAIIEAAGEAGLVPAQAAATLGDAARLFGALWHIIRLTSEGRFVPDQAPPGVLAVLLREGGAPSLPELEARLAETRAAVAALFTELVR
jgi:glutamate-ammonia-ligase adenylyltransferase